MTLLVTYMLRNGNLCRRGLGLIFDRDFQVNVAAARIKECLAPGILVLNGGRSSKSGEK